MSRRAAVALAALLTWSAGAAMAQNPIPLPAGGTRGGGADVPGIVKWGKWGAAALFLGLTTAGVLEHQSADDAYASLTRYCSNIGPCNLGPDGRYLNPTAEQMYQEVVDGDRQARALFITGQVALAGAAALFVVELMKERGTRNIPYSGFTAAPYRGGWNVGWRLTFGSP